MGDLSKLNTDQRLSYYKSVCESVGLNPLTKPFDYINLNGKLVLYAKRDATDQLRKIHKVSIKITAREKIEDIYIVTAQGTDKDGRADESTGAVNVQGLKGDNLANAFLKAETKAKRRVTLSLCGLGLLDETEVATISDAKPFEESQALQNVAGIKEIMAEVHPTKPARSHEAEILDEEPGSGSFVIEFGKHKNKRLDEMDFHEMCGYVDWLRQKLQSADVTGKLRDSMQKTVDAGLAYKAQFTNKDPKIDTSEQLPF